MCCEPSGYTKDQIDGECPSCGEPTIDGEAYECCGYSPRDCAECGFAPCDGAC